MDNQRIQWWFLKKINIMELTETGSNGSGDTNYAKNKLEMGFRKQSTSTVFKMRQRDNICIYSHKY